MKRYEPGTPRALIGFAAVALTAATLAVAVAAPAAMDYGTREISVLTQSGSAAETRASAADTSTSTIDVVAIRGLRVVPVAQAKSNVTKPGLQS